METIKSLNKEAKESNYADFYEMLEYWAINGNTDFETEFKTYTSRLLFAIIDECWSRHDRQAWTLYKAAKAVLKARLHI